jgi:hypothetical protein
MRRLVFPAPEGSSTGDLAYLIPETESELELLRDLAEEGVFDSPGLAQPRKETQPLSGGSRWLW